MSKFYSALLIAGGALVFSTTSSISQESTVKGLASARSTFDVLERATDSIASRDPETGAPLVPFIVRPTINSNNVQKFGSKNERIQAVEELIDKAQSVGISAEKVGLTDFIRFEATRNQLDALASQNLFDSITEDVAEPPTMASASTNIQLANLRQENVQGLGKTVVILDTGVDTSHRDFGNRVVSQACFSSNTSTATSLCPNGQSVDTNRNSGQHCDTNDISACDHGTHVAAIAAGNRLIPNDSGVASQANIIAIQVFSRFAKAASCAPRSAPCVLSYRSDQLAALSYVRQTLAQSHPIAAVNMSLGGGSYTSCPNDVRAGEVDRLRSLGIATVISSGNSYHVDTVGAPGCIPNAITVGAVNDNGRIVAFSNSGDAVDFLAPGADITAAVPNNTYDNKWGTSMSAPVVTGLIAALQGHYSVSVSTIEQVLKDTGVPTPTLNSSRLRPWIRAHDAWQKLDDLRPSGEHVWMRDQWSDTGDEPNSTGLGLSSSPYIWFRNQSDCETAAHNYQNPEFGSLNFGCVKVHNSGKTSAEGTLQLFYTNANFDNGASWKLISSDFRTLPPNTTAIAEFPWASVPSPGHYCAIARWVPKGENLQLSFPNGFANAVYNSNDLIWRNFTTIDRLKGPQNSNLKFESNHDGSINMVIDVTALSPEEQGELGDLIIELGGDPGDLSNEPTSSNYIQEGRFIILPLKPGISYIPDIKLPAGEVEFKLHFQFKNIDDNLIGRKHARVTISDVIDVQQHKLDGSGSLSAITYELVN